jgi:hypothetical protein
MKQFRVSYEIKGTRVINVFIEDQDLPDNWESLESEKQDEWLYERQNYSVIQFEDIDYGKAISVLPVVYLSEVK